MEMHKKRKEKQRTKDKSDFTWQSDDSLFGLHKTTTGNVDSALHLGASDGDEEAFACSPAQTNCPVESLSPIGDRLVGGANGVGFGSMRAHGT